MTMVWCLLISRLPRTRLVVTMTGNISGVRPTAVAMAKIKASVQLPLVKPLTTRTRGAMMAVMVKSSLEMFLIPVSKVVSFISVSAIWAAILPNTVCSPVAKTTPRPEPETIVVPLKRMFG